MVSNGSSERHQNNSLKAIVCFARFLGPNVSFLDICKKDTVLSFLDTKIKNSELDPEKKWINTWNDYARRIKHFLRWLYNAKSCSQDLQQTDWYVGESITAGPTVTTIPYDVYFDDISMYILI